ncbi:MAG: hypothetical protein ABII09_10855 [Planctomycetota bacterium]
MRLLPRINWVLGRKTRDKLDPRQRAKQQQQSRTGEELRPPSAGKPRLHRTGALGMTKANLTRATPK